MPSFDIVSKADLPSVKNAIDGVQREINTRYDFKGSDSSISLNNEHNWNTVLRGIIIDAKFFMLLTCMLLDESLWLSVATPVKKVLLLDSVACR